MNRIYRKHMILASAMIMSSLVVVECTMRLTKQTQQPIVDNVSIVKEVFYDPTNPSKVTGVLISEVDPSDPTKMRDRKIDMPQK